jgi:hypothetical protein
MSLDAFDDSQFALIKRHNQGLISTIIIGKCCKVESYMLPAQDIYAETLS